jgi:ribosomal protein L11 methyltransferase
MNWQQLKIQIIPEHVDFIEPQLLAAGAVSITYLDAEDQPVFQEELDSTPLWDSLVLCALFEETTELGELLSWLGSNASIVNRASLEVEKIEDQAWERSWMDNFSAMQFGEKLWICPSWQEPPDPSATNIMLDPGLAFGSGSHATTALCLQWLATQDLQGKDIVDYGCGSGILAIAAALLDAQSVQGVDNDPQAVLATNDNCERNGLLQGRVGTFLPEEYDSISTPESVDILLANILAAPLLSLASKFASLVKPHGSIVLSGLLAEQADAITEVYSEWFEMSAAVQREDWIRLSGIKR